MAKFKVGDIVKLTSKTADGFEKYAQEYRDGRFKISEVDDSGEITYYRDAKVGYWVRDEYLEKVKIAKKNIVSKIKITNKDEIVGQNDAKRQLEVSIRKNIPALLVGETGTGKTSIIRELAKAHNKKFTRIPITGETTPDDLLGRYELREGNTEWVDGILVRAMKNGHYLTVDEINMALPEVLALLHELFDDDRSVTVNQHHGERVVGRNGFRAFATMNPVDEYAGTKELNKALKSRFGMTIEMKYVDQSIEVQIVQQKCKIKEPVARKIVDFGQWARKAKTDDEIFYTCSTRDLIQWGTLTKDLPMKEAFELAVLNKGNGDREKMAKFYSTLDNEYQMLENDGYELSIDYFNQEVSRIKTRENKLATERKAWERDIKRTTEKIRKDVIKTLVADSKKTVKA